MMRNKRLLILFLLFLIISLGTCFYLNKKMQPTTFAQIRENVREVNIDSPQYPYEHRGYYTDGIYEDDIESLEELYAASDVVAIVTPVSSRQDSQNVKTKVKIEKVLQGNVNENITIFEQYFYDDFGRLIIDAGCTLPMNQNEKYLLFLKMNDDYPSGDVYRLTSLYYGKYPVSNELKVYDSKKEYYEPFGKDILEYDVVFIDVQDKIDLLSISSSDIGNEHEEKEKKALIKYKELYKQTYLTFYEQLKDLFS